MSATLDRHYGGVLPERTQEQRMEALAKGNAHRSKRRQLKEDIKAGRVTIADALAEPVPEWLETMKVYDLLRAIPYYGKARLDKTFRRITMSPSKTIGGLTERQRGELVGWVQSDLERRDACR
jgi:hypothetical protein